MTTILRTPWIGSEYHSQKHKVLFVGESHYSKNYFESSSTNENLTIQCVKEYCNGDWGNRTWGVLVSQFSKIFSTGNYARKDFFERVAYMNYIQHCMKEPSDNPFKYFIHNADYQLHFQNIVNQIQPDVVILFSKRIDELWSYEGCGITKFLEDKGIQYFSTGHLSRITSDGKLEIERVINKIHQCSPK